MTTHTAVMIPLPPDARVDSSVLAVANAMLRGMAVFARTADGLAVTLDEGAIARHLEVLRHVDDLARRYSEAAMTEKAAGI